MAKEMIIIKKAKTCHRCNGRGYLNAYKHIENGRCFKCGGGGRLPDGTRQIIREIPESVAIDPENAGLTEAQLLAKLMVEYGDYMKGKG